MLSNTAHTEFTSGWVLMVRLVGAFLILLIGSKPIVRWFAARKASTGSESCDDEAHRPASRPLGVYNPDRLPPAEEILTMFKIQQENLRREAEKAERAVQDDFLANLCNALTTEILSLVPIGLQTAIEIRARKLPTSLIVELSQEEKQTNRVSHLTKWQKLSDGCSALDITECPDVDELLTEMHRRVAQILRVDFVPKGYRIYVVDKTSKGNSGITRSLYISWGAFEDLLKVHEFHPFFAGAFH